MTYEYEANTDKYAGFFSLCFFICLFVFSSVVRALKCEIFFMHVCVCIFMCRWILHNVLIYIRNSVAIEKMC